MNENKVYFAPMMANELGINFTDKRNRNPNWTDQEIVRFLEILQEEKVMLDLAANKNKQVQPYYLLILVGGCYFIVFNVYKLSFNIYLTKLGSLPI